MVKFKDLNVGGFMYMYHYDSSKCNWVVSDKVIMNINKDRNDSIRFDLGYHSRKGIVITESINICNTYCDKSQTSIGDMELFTTRDAAMKHMFKEKPLIQAF